MKGFWAGGVLAPLGETWALIFHTCPIQKMDLPLYPRLPHRKVGKAVALMLCSVKNVWWLPILQAPGRDDGERDAEALHVAQGDRHIPNLDLCGDW